MTILGADPDQLKSTAQRVLTRADDYENANHQISYWLRRMDWQGPEADRFCSLYESQMRPQLDSAAAFLRQAAAELRAQASDQIRASASQDVVTWICGTAFLPGRGLPPSNTADAAARLRETWAFAKESLEFDTLVGAGHYLVRHLQRLIGSRAPGLPFAPYVVDKVDDLAGIGKLLGKHGSKVLGVVGIGISAWSLPGDIRDLQDDADDLSKALTEGDWSAAAESFEQVLYSYSDVPMDVGGILLGLGALTGNPYLAAAGAGLYASGVIVKVGAVAFDKLRDPIANGLQELHGFAEDRLADTVQWIGEETREIREEAGEALGEVGREVREARREIANADGAIEKAFEFAEGAAESTWEAVEGGFEVGREFTKTTVVGAVEVARRWFPSIPYLRL